MKNIFRWLIPFAFICAAVVLAVWFVKGAPNARKKKEKPISIPVVEAKHIQVGNYPVKIHVMGKVVPARELNLRSQVSGKIVKVAENFKGGELVEKGQLLLTVDATDYEIQLQQKQAALKKSQAALRQEKGKQKTAKLELKLSGRGKNLSKEQKFLALRGPQLMQAEADVANYQSLVKAAKLNISRTKVVAPWNALVISKNISGGSVIGTSEVIATLVDSSEFWIKAEIPLEMLSFIRGRSDVAVEIFNRRNDVAAMGKIINITGKLESETMLSSLTVSVPDPFADDCSGICIPNIFLDDYVEMAIDGGALKGVFRVERKNVHSGEIWLLRDNQLHVLKPEKVFEDKAYIYINADIAADDLLITSNIITPVDGMKLKIMVENKRTEEKSSARQKKMSPDERR
ncbi:MAG: HlyD family efflux transporter periplasmic adaptor subunit [Gammaproteobacteria bacterium]|nr:MAG: HlyD family efflux transporter periplasmic adaptor subunit [Gammaproteobacteria bacterium]